MTVTPSGVREGDPAALAALCAVRGPSVVAYCRHVAGEAQAGTAAADAFARFRVGVVTAGDTTTLNPEALLISATRTSAAARADITAQGHCANVPVLLAARAEKTIAVADLERLEAHLEGCWACRAPVARFMAAERAYRDPPEKTVDAALTEQIVAALVAAVPPPAPPAQVSPNGAQAHPADPPVADPHATQSFTVEQATEHFAAPGTAEPDAGGDAEADPPPRRRREKRPTGAAVLLSRLRPKRSPRGPRARPQPSPPPVPSAAGAARERPGRSRPGLRLAVVLPIILILLALLGALYVSGVFGGKDPESSPRVAVPAGTTSEIDAVPGAEQASGDAVEAAKARERGDAPAAKKRKKAPAKATGAQPAGTPAAASPPPAPAATPPSPPASTANSPAPPPAPATNPGSDPPKRIDAGSGATGAEQIPPAADASDVPELAPPAEPAAP